MLHFLLSCQLSLKSAIDAVGLLHFSQSPWVGGAEEGGLCERGEN